MNTFSFAVASGIHFFLSCTLNTQFFYSLYTRILQTFLYFANEPGDVHLTKYFYCQTCIYIGIKQLLRHTFSHKLSISIRRAKINEKKNIYNSLSFQETFLFVKEYFLYRFYWRIMISCIFSHMYNNKVNKTFFWVYNSIRFSLFSWNFFVFSCY